MVKIAKKPAADSEAKMGAYAKEKKAEAGGALLNLSEAETAEVKSSGKLAKLAKKPAASIENEAKLGTDAMEQKAEAGGALLSVSEVETAEVKSSGKRAKLAKKPAASVENDDLDASMEKPFGDGDELDLDLDETIEPEQETCEKPVAEPEQETVRQLRQQKPQTKKTLQRKMDLDLDETIEPKQETSEKLDGEPEQETARQPLQQKLQTKLGTKKPLQRKKDPNAPKRPPSGAYGVFVAEKRGEIKRQAEATGDTSFKAIATASSAAWKALSDEQRTAYEKRYQELKVAYNAAVEAYKATKPPEQEADETSGAERTQEPSGQPRRWQKRQMKFGTRNALQRTKDPNAPKKPAGGAYGVFVAENREEIKRQAEAAGDKSFKGVAKASSAAWKSLSEEQRTTYEKRYQELKAAYNAAVEAYNATKPPEQETGAERKQEPSGQPRRWQNRQMKFGTRKALQRRKDPNAPKKPAGGAYGVFVAEKREEIKRQAEAAGDKSFKGIAKASSAAWKSLSEEERSAYEKRYQELKASYNIALEAYKTSKPLEEADAQTPVKEAARKRAPSLTPDEKASNRKMVKLGPKVTEGVELDEDVLKEASGLGLLASLENLAQRRDVVERGIDGSKILRALKASGGRITRAKLVLVGS